MMYMRVYDRISRKKKFISLDNFVYHQRPLPPFMHSTQIILFPRFTIAGRKGQISVH